MTEAASIQGEEIYIVGGANSAGQAAIYFAKLRQQGHHARPRRVALVQHVALPGRADRARAQYRGPLSDRRRAGQRRRATSSRWCCATPRPARARPCRPGPCSSSSAPFRRPNGCKDSVLLRRARLHPDRPRYLRGRARAPGRWTAIPSCSRPAFPASSRPAMSAMAPASASPPPSVKARWPSCPSGNTAPTPACRRRAVGRRVEGTERM